MKIYLLDFILIPQSLLGGPVGRRQRFQCKQPHLKKELLKKVCSKFKSDEVFCRNDCLLKPPNSAVAIRYLRPKANTIFAPPTKTADGKCERSKRKFILLLFFSTAIKHVLALESCAEKVCTSSYRMPLGVCGQSSQRCDCYSFLKKKGDRLWDFGLNFCLKHKNLTANLKTV